VPKSDSKTRWLMWLAGVIVSILTIVALAYAGSANDSMLNVKRDVRANSDGITDLKERTGKIEVHIEYIRDGVKRLEIERGTYPTPEK